MTDIKVTIDNSLDDVRVFALENVLENVTAIEQAGEAAIESAEDAEAWAIGERNGVPVSADDETYQNNSKYYAESASVMANKFFVTDTASGAVASFSDGADDIPMDSVLCHINPVQDLHGYDKPWAGGAGKNLFDKDNITIANGAISETGEISATGAYGHTEEYIPVSPSTEYIFSGTIVNASYYNGVAFYDNNYAFIERYMPDSSNTNAHFTTPSNCSFIRFNFNKNVIDVDTIQIEQGSTATAYEPYENICPIEGHTALGLMQTGKNLFDKNNITVSNGAISATGAITVTGAYGYTEEYIPVAPSTEYIFSGTIVNSSYYNGVAFYDRNKAFIERYMPSASNTNAHFTTPVNCEYIRFNFNKNVIDMNTVQIEQGSTATAYEPYSGTTTTIPLGQTVYGGTLDVVSGVLTVDRAIVDLGSLTWNQNPDSSIFRAVISDIYNRQRDTPNNAICSSYVGQNVWIATGLNDSSFMIRGDIKTVYVRDDSYSDATTFKTAMNGVTLCYELATPITVQVSPHEVNSLLGTNNIWHNCNGNIDVVYKTDTKLYIDKRLAELS